MNAGLEEQSFLESNADLVEALEDILCDAYDDDQEVNDKQRLKDYMQADEEEDNPNSDTESIFNCGMELDGYEFQSENMPNRPNHLLIIIKSTNPRLGSSFFHAIKKLISLVLASRTALENRCWTALLKKIQEFDKRLFHSDLSNQLGSLGPLLPILSRLFDDIDHLVIQDPITNSKGYRHSLGKDDAKALSILIQKWPKLWQHETNVFFEQLVNKHSENKPKVIADTHNSITRAVLNSIESILLDSPGQLKISRVGLDKFPTALIKIQSIITWYLSFIPISRREHLGISLQEKAGAIIQSIKIFDISHNTLSTIPRDLPDILPKLAVLNLSHNPIFALPTTCIKWSELNRIMIIQPMTSPKIPRLVEELKAKPNLLNEFLPPSLVDICLKQLKTSMPRIGHKQHDFDLRLPPHLVEAILKGKMCESCQNFLWPDVQPLYGTVLFCGNAPYYRDTRSITCGPSFFCKNCLRPHVYDRIKNRLCRCQTCTIESRYLDDGYADIGPWGYLQYK